MVSICPPISDFSCLVLFFWEPFQERHSSLVSPSSSCSTAFLTLSKVSGLLGRQNPLHGKFTFFVNCHYVWSIRWSVCILKSERFHVFHFLGWIIIIIIITFLIILADLNNVVVRMVSILPLFCNSFWRPFQSFCGMFQVHQLQLVLRSFLSYIAFLVL